MEQQVNHLPTVNGLMIVGVIANLIVSLICFVNYNAWLGGILSLFALTSIVGVFLASILPGRSIGPNLVVIGSIGFLPIGLIGILGAKKYMEIVNMVEFNKRRN